MVTSRVIGRSYVDNFPVKGAWERREALEGDVKAERIEDLSRIVFDYDVVDVNLCHLARFFKSIIFNH